MLRKLLKISFSISCLSAVFVANAGTLWIELSPTDGNQDVSNKTVMVNSLNDRNYRGQAVSDVLGSLQINNIPAGPYDVFVLDEAGNVIGKSAGELSDENSEQQVTIGL